MMRILWGVLVPRELLRVSFGSLLFYPFRDYSHTLHHHLFEAQVSKDSRRALGQRWKTTPAKEAKYVKDGHCYCVRVCSMLSAHQHRLVSLLLCI